MTKQIAPPAPSHSDGPDGSVVHFSAHEVFIVDPGTTSLKIDRIYSMYKCGITPNKYFSSFSKDLTIYMSFILFDKRWPFNQKNHEINWLNSAPWSCNVRIHTYLSQICTRLLGADLLHALSVSYSIQLCI